MDGISTIERMTPRRADTSAAATIRLGMPIVSRRPRSYRFDTSPSVRARPHTLLYLWIPAGSCGRGSREEEYK